MPRRSQRVSRRDLPASPARRFPGERRAVSRHTSRRSGPTPPPANSRPVRPAGTRRSRIRKSAARQWPGWPVKPRGPATRACGWDRRILPAAAHRARPDRQRPPRSALRDAHRAPRDTPRHAVRPRKGWNTPKREPLSIQSPIADRTKVRPSLAPPVPEGADPRRKALSDSPKIPLRGGADIGFYCAARPVPTVVRGASGWRRGNERGNAPGRRNAFNRTWAGGYESGVQTPATGPKTRGGRLTTVTFSTLTRSRPWLLLNTSLVSNSRVQGGIPLHGFCEYYRSST